MKFKIIPNEQTPAIPIWPDGRHVLEDNYKLLVKFLSFATRQHNCAGLASNQVSCDGRRIMIPFFAIKYNHFWDIVVSPVILQFNGKKQDVIEGCLTWQGKYIIAERYPEIVVKYYNFKEQKTEIITGLRAQVWQHEYAHLKGINEIVRDRNLK